VTAPRVFFISCRKKKVKAFLPYESVEFIYKVKKEDTLRVGNEILLEIYVEILQKSLKFYDMMFYF